MKRWLILFLVAGSMPLTMAAQDDDMYFVPSKQRANRLSPYGNVQHGTYYSGSNRSIDEYNRHGVSFYEMIPGDTAHNDIIDFSPEIGVYPDSTGADYGITHRLRRFEGYEPSSAYWAGYNAGRFDSWYSPWYYPSWHSYYYDPWYYSWYGWYDPWYYRGWGGYYYGGGGGAYVVSGRYGSNSLANRNYTGSIRSDGSTRGRNFTGYRGGGGVNSSTASTSLGTTRYNSARNRTVAGHTSYSNSYSNSVSSSSGNFSGSRSAFNNSVTTTTSSFSGGGGGGSVSRGGGGGGGGSRGGGISAGGRR